MPQRSGAATATAVVDDLLHALADPTRRAVVERLGRGPAATSELARPFPMALPSFAQHLGVLERCGLVQSHKSGRVRTYRLAPQALAPLDDWLGAQRRMWTTRLDQLDQHLTDLHAGATSATRPSPTSPTRTTYTREQP